MTSAIQFSLRPEQYQEFLEWQKEQDRKVALKQKKSFAHYGAIGGCYEFTFIPTGIGMGVRVKNSLTGDTIDLSHTEKW